MSIQITKPTLEQIESLKTPFYYYDINLLEDTLKIVTKNASEYGFKIHYALKANFDDHILGIMKKWGLGVDCVSGGEVRLAVESGFNPQEVVFAGVGKTDSEIEYALDKGIYSFNCESREEVEVINHLAASKGVIAPIALRINPDVDPKTHKYITTGLKDNKFGISYIEIDEIIEKLPTLKNIKVIGIHFHIGSQITQFEVFEYLCKRVNTISSWFTEKGINIEHINVGGGLGINYDHPEAEPVPDFARYFKIFADNLTLTEGQTLHFELGRSIVCQCGMLVSKVLYNKKTSSGKEYILIDASMTELIRPALYGAKHTFENLSKNGKDVEDKTYGIAGGVCESSDIFSHETTLPETKRGDIILIKSAGAYGRAMASQYNLRDLPCSYYSDKL